MPFDGSYATTGSSSIHRRRDSGGGPWSAERSGSAPSVTTSQPRKRLARLVARCYKESEVTGQICRPVSRPADARGGGEVRPYGDGPAKLAKPVRPPNAIHRGPCRKAPSAPSAVMLLATSNGPHGQLSQGSPATACCGRGRLAVGTRSRPGRRRRLGDQPHGGSMNDTNPDPYAVLGVAPTASRQQVNRAYRRLLRRHHPDTRADGTVPVQGSDGRVPLADVLAAYAVLGDPVTRAAHDRNRTPVPGFTAGSATGPPVVPVAGPVPRPRSDARRGPRTVTWEEADPTIRVGERSRVRGVAQQPGIRVGPVLWRPAR